MQRRAFHPRPRQKAGRLSIVGSLLLLVLAGQAHAQTSTPSLGQYVVGWNLAGGPPGTDFSSATAMFAYDGSQYVVPPSPQAQLCTGYWLYFEIVPTVLLAQSPGGSSQDCQVRGGWTMVGNPFDGPATLPADVIAMHWNPADGTWHQVHKLAPGGAVFIYSSTSGAVTLTAST